jgi:predicted metal-dependent hydrolase
LKPKILKSNNLALKTKPTKTKVAAIKLKNQKTAISALPHETLKAAFKERVKNWASQLDVHYTWLGIRRMPNKWASCSTLGTLNFSEDLLTLSSDLWDYVIVHELLHFSVPNHGKLWKSLMRAHLGDYEERQAKLNAIAGLGLVK